MGIGLSRAVALLCAQGARSEASEQRPGLLFIGSMRPRVTARRFPPLPAGFALSLIPAQVVEPTDYRTDLLTVLGIWINVLKLANQRDIFGTQFFHQFIYFLGQLLSFRRALRFVDLVIQLDNFAIDLGLELVAADDFDDILCVRLQLDHARLLSLRIHRHGGDCQNRNSRYQVHGGILLVALTQQQSCQRSTAVHEYSVFRRRAWATISGEVADEG